MKSRRRICSAIIYVRPRTGHEGCRIFLWYVAEGEAEAAGRTHFSIWAGDGELVDVEGVEGSGICVESLGGSAHGMLSAVYSRPYLMQG